MIIRIKTKRIRDIKKLIVGKYYILYNKQFKFLGVCKLRKIRDGGLIELGGLDLKSGQDIGHGVFFNHPQIKIYSVFNSLEEKE